MFDCKTLFDESIPMCSALFSVLTELNRNNKKKNQFASIFELKQTIKKKRKKKLSFVIFQTKPHSKTENIFFRSNSIDLCVRNWIKIDENSSDLFSKSSDSSKGIARHVCAHQINNKNNIFKLQPLNYIIENL